MYCTSDHTPCATLSILGLLHWVGSACVQVGERHISHEGEDGTGTDDKARQ